MKVDKTPSHSGSNISIKKGKLSMQTIRGVTPGFDPRYTKDFHCPQSK